MKQRVDARPGPTPLRLAPVVRRIDEGSKGHHAKLEAGTGHDAPADVDIAHERMLLAQIMEELDHRRRLRALFLEEVQPNAFVKAANLPGTSRYRVTARGKRIAESPKGEELTFEEIV